MPHALAQAVEIVTTALTVAGLGYFLAVIVATRVFLHERRKPCPQFASAVSILKSLKGLDPGMLDAFRSHCRQNYAGQFELLFGVGSLNDPAVAAVKQLQAEFPDVPIRLIECPQSLGTNGKVSTLAQLAAHARYDFLLINDSDITVGPHYLERVMCCFADPTPGKRGGKKTHEVGMVTALYRGKAHGTLPSRLEALAISTQFAPGVLLSKMIEGGMHYGLGSTLAMRRDALEKIGGLLAVVDHLADDYELGARIAHAGYRVVLSSAVVETSVPAYKWREFFDHQLRWLRTVRCSRPAGYAGLIFTHGFAWALINLLASGLSPIAMWLLALSFFLRLGQAMTVGSAALGDHETLANLWLLPALDVIAMGLWVAGFASNTIVWRGLRFTLKDGKLAKV